MQVDHQVARSINGKDVYKRQQLRLEDGAQLHEFDGNTVIVLVGNVTKANVGALNYARSIGDYVVAMHVSMDENVEKEKEIQEEFKKHFPDCLLYTSAFK